MFNQYLRVDGFELVERTRMSDRPIYVGRFVGVIGTPGVAAAKEAFCTAGPGYVSQQISRMEAAVANDPSLAIGTAKELVESCCKTILVECSVPFSKNADLPELVKLTAKELDLTPADIPDQAKASDTIKRLLSNLASITQGVAELRNHYGTGHGKAEILAKSQIAPEAAILIGDEIRDAQAAMAAGISFGAVTWGYNHIDSLILHGVKEIFTHAGELSRKLIPGGAKEFM
jgi:hypothetical protein